MNNDINVEKIMSDIRADIVAKGRDKEKLSFIDQEAALDSNSSDSGLEDAVDYISYNYEVKPYQLLQGNKIAVFFKRLIRRLTSFLIMPIVAQQNTLNYYYYRVCENILTVKARAELLEKRISALEEARKNSKA